MSSFAAALFSLNLLDMALAVAVVLMARAGYRSGLIAGIAGWVGVIAGVMLFFWLTPKIMDFFAAGSSTVWFVITVAMLAVFMTLTSQVAQRIGRALTRVVRATPLRGIDRIAGMGGAVLTFGLIVWLLLPVAGFVPGAVSTQVRESVAFSVLQRTTPEPPDALTVLGTLIDVSRIPDVFDHLRTTADTGSPPADIAVPADIVQRATAATVRVTSVGCGSLSVGSGWTARDNLVVTNAHVVAGTDEVTVRLPDGKTRVATVVRFDAKRDLAVLAIENLGLQPLALASSVADSDAVAIGYPEGQRTPRVAAVTVREQRMTIGSDIYGDKPANREVVFLAAALRLGDSGAPVIDAKGHVVGVVFAVSTARSTTAYALASVEVETVLAGPETDGAGRCL
ncbi:MAG: MarP family serine protease [Nitriliruptoraceae bacterium]